MTAIPANPDIAYERGYHDGWTSARDAYKAAGAAVLDAYKAHHAKFHADCDIQGPKPNGLLDNGRDATQ